MILSGRDLRWYVDTNRLKIEPLTDRQFQQNGIDLILNTLEQQGNHFYLGCTREYLELPDDLMAWVQLRSSWARRGFIIPPTIVDAGFRGELTLEILRFGKMTESPIGERFAHLIFGKLTSPTEPYRGKYDKQRGITQAR